MTRRASDCCAACGSWGQCDRCPASLAAAEVARAEGAAAERAAVVAYLRPLPYIDGPGSELADEFERGEHLQPRPCVLAADRYGCAPAVEGPPRADACEPYGWAIHGTLATVAEWLRLDLAPYVVAELRTGAAWPHRCQDRDWFEGGAYRINCGEPSRRPVELRGCT